MSDKEIKGEKIDLNIKIVAVIIIAVVSYVAWFYNTVVIPLGQLQVSVAQIQETLSNSTTQYQALDKRMSVVENKLNIQ